MMMLKCRATFLCDKDCASITNVSVVQSTCITDSNAMNIHEHNEKVIPMSYFVQTLLTLMHISTVPFPPQLKLNKS